MAEKEFLTMDSPLEHSAPNLRMFTFLVGTFEFFGFMAMLLVGIWLGHFQGGYAWSEQDPVHEFNYHPLMMIIAFVFIHGNGEMSDTL